MTRASIETSSLHAGGVMRCRMYLYFTAWRVERCCACAGPRSCRCPATSILYLRGLFVLAVFNLINFREDIFMTIFCLIFLITSFWHRCLKILSTSQIEPSPLHLATTAPLWVWVTKFILWASSQCNFSWSLHEFVNLFVDSEAATCTV